MAGDMQDVNEPNGNSDMVEDLQRTVTIVFWYKVFLLHPACYISLTIFVRKMQNLFVCNT